MPTRQSKWPNAGNGRNDPTLASVEQVSQAEAAGTVRHLFAAITCSKRCAAAVLAAQVPAEDAEREGRRELFRS